jgi:hypothetical protein
MDDLCLKDPRGKEISQEKKDFNLPWGVANAAEFQKEILYFSFKFAMFCVSEFRHLKSDTAVSTTLYNPTLQ